jgi:simple sugar transport system ATP-binding protein
MATAPSTGTRSKGALLEAVGLCKEYGAVRALQDVSFRLRHGEVVGVVGDNGAGKSTLVAILAGAIAPTKGEVKVEGQKLPADPARARAMGIEVVYQDLALSLDLDASDNMFLGREVKRGGWVGEKVGWLNRPAMRARAAEALQHLNVRVPGLRRPVRTFSGGQRQGVAVARATTWATSLLLLDEPTAALGVEQQGQVAAMVKRVSNRGIAVLLVSHHLPQVVQLCDRVLVLWHGRLVADVSRPDLSPELLLGWITGTALNGATPA